MAAGKRRPRRRSSSRDAQRTPPAAISTPLARQGVDPATALSDLPLTDRLALAEKLRQLEHMASSLLSSANAAAAAQSGSGARSL